MTLLAVPAAAAVGIMVITGGTIGDAGNVWGLDAKPLWPFVVLNGFSPIASCGEAVCLALLVYALLRNGAIRRVSSGRWLAVGLASLYIAVP